MSELNSNEKTRIFDPEEYGDLRKRIIEILDSNKAEDILTLNLKPHIGYDLYFLIATALSNTHLKKLVSDIMIDLKKEGVYPGYVPNETDYTSGWIALDYGEIIVHVFTREKREYYNLEELWNESEQE